MSRLLRFLVLIGFVMVLAACGGASSNGGSDASGDSGSNGDSGASSVPAGDDPAAVALALLAAVYNNDQDAFASVSCAELQAGMDAFAGVQLPGDGTFDVSGLQAEVANQTDNQAEITVTGSVKLTLTVGGQTTTTDVDINTITLTLKNENGWKYCG